MKRQNKNDPYDFLFPCFLVKYDASDLISRGGIMGHQLGFWDIYILIIPLFVAYLDVYFCLQYQEKNC